MKLDLLRHVAEFTARELGNKGFPTYCYYFFDGEWRPIDKSVPTPSGEFALALNKSRGETVAYHATKSKRAWFHLPEFAATFSVEFPSSPKLATRQSVRTQIENLRTNAVNAFKVTHNELTGLLSRDAFRERLREAIVTINATQPKQFVVASEGQPLKTISLLAFDIDKFKQVNDTYGHIYGDQVLKAFAWRLEATAEELRQEFGDKTQISLGHPSGEEFLALVEGQLSNEELTHVAERFRLCIADEPLPSDAEWERLTAAAELAKVPLPPKTQRSITTSVGVACYSGSTPSDSSTALVLLDKADIALYKSKSGGRDRVTQFDDILQGCGRVIEYDESTGVVAIDIGSKVGVLVGQEFRVFPPTYCGQTAFTIDDGRTRRTLGTYPKIELCRIVIFNSQSDISFGYLASQSSERRMIPNGAILEAVPLGNITHLIERPHGLSTVVGGHEPTAVSGRGELRESIESLIGKEKRPFAAVVRFKLESEYHQKYGSAALNRALAQLFSSLRTEYASAQRVGLIDTTAICVVGEASTFDVDAMSAFLEENYPSGDELEPICGCYLPDKAEKDAEGDGQESARLDHHAIELGRFAISYADGYKNQRVQQFSVAIAEKVLTQYRQSRSFAAGVTDYLRLKEIGITSATLENTAGLCYSALGENAMALECYLRAIDLKPDNIIFRGNAAILASRTKQVDIGLKALSELNAEKCESLKKLHPAAYWEYAVLLAEAKQAGSEYFDRELMKRIGSAACQMDGAGARGKFQLVRAAVDSLG